jgi:hypothetical protein
MAEHIYLIGGSKGGVGKSIVTMAVLDWLLEEKAKVHFIESDTTNPDVFKSYREDLESHQLLNLDDAEGWIQLANACEAKADHHIVINTAARTNEAMKNYGQMLVAAVQELKRSFVTFWVINRQRDSVELLREHLEAFPNSTLHVVRNCYFGGEEKFELYNASKVREKLEGKGGKSLNFPDLADRVTDDLYSSRMSIAGASRRLPIGNRMELSRWRTEIRKNFAEVLG